MCDSYRTLGLLTHICLPFAPMLLDGRHLLCTITTLLLDDRHHLCMTTYSAMTRPFVLVFRLFGCVVSALMYISALLCVLGTPSKFSSVPILVADELAYSSSCETTILG